MSLPSISLAWFHRLSRRERVLTGLVGGAVFVILNLAALRFLLGAYTDLSSRYAEDRRTLLLLRALAGERDTWTQRNDWLKATQPVLANRDRAGTALYEQLQGIARTQQVIVSSLQIKPPGTVTAPVKGDAPQVVSVEGDTQGDWRETVRFLAEIQKPENFLVFDQASLRTNPTDARQMRCHFLVSKWYAPAAK